MEAQDSTTAGCGLEGDPCARDEALWFVANHVPVCIAQCDSSGNYKFVNLRYAALFGLRPADIIGKHPRDVLGEEAYAGASPYIESALAGQPVEYELTLPITLAGPRMVRASYAPERDSAGHVVGFLAAIVDVTEHMRSERALARANRALRALSGCNAALIHATTESELVNEVCRLLVEAAGYAMAWVGYVEHDPKKSVRVAAQYGDRTGYLNSINISWADSEHGRGPTGAAIRSGMTQVNQNMLTNPRMTPWRDAALLHRLYSSIALPLSGEAGTLGALNIYAREPDAFNSEELRLLEELAANLAFGLAALRTRAERDGMAKARHEYEKTLQRSLEDSIHAIANTVELRDPYTAGHQTRVASLAAAIANSLAMSGEEVHGIELAASIHDVGKIQVPAEILVKPSKLTELEFVLIKQHAQAGYEILKDIAFPWPIATMVWQHHERLDGSGYPLGLKGDEVLLGARIIAVADVVEAMASYRPYREALGIASALATIKKERALRLDPFAVDACVELFCTSRFAFPG